MHSSLFQKFVKVLSPLFVGTVLFTVIPPFLISTVDYSMPMMLPAGLSVQIFTRWRANEKIDLL